MDLFRIAPDLPDENEAVERLRTFGEYVSEYVQIPEHRRLFIRLSRLLRITCRISESWRFMYREQAIAELTEVMNSLHELEAEADQVPDTMLREHAFDWIDAIAYMRRSVAEEVRWDVETTNAGEAL